MDSASFLFVAFGLATAVVSNFSRSRVWRSLVLLGTSILFLRVLAHDVRVLLPLIGLLFLGYVGLLLLQRGVSKSATWIIVAVIFVYIWLKQYTFLPQAIFLRSAYLTLGLSYIFFRVLHLLIEAGDGTLKQRVGPFAFLTYSLNFTTFVSGPIQRYEDFAEDQFAAEPIPLGSRVIGLQLERIIRGFFKVNVVALLLHAFQVDAMEQITHPYAPLQLKLWAALRLAILYPFFLYCNFSGYIDIVIALARLMRLRLPENFNRPFSASSCIDFWNRWHITLSNWLKTYVYNPLLITLMGRFSSLRVQPFLGVLCFFVTFFLIGVWHGRTSEFIFFGVLTGAGMSVNKLWQIWLTHQLGRKGYKRLAGNPLYMAFGRGLNFVWFAFTLLWFWGNWEQIGQLYAALSASQWAGIWLAAWACLTVALAAWEWLRSWLLSFTTDEGPVFTSRYALVVYATALGLAAVVINVLLHQPAPAIVYKAF
jgi:D-alanyl-lipoteichoic acid acyltransferase DltB (MBOAT superfamily)